MAGENGGQLQKNYGKEGSEIIIMDTGVHPMRAKLRLFRSTVRRALRDLERTGWVETVPHCRENGSSSSNLYRLK